MRHDDPQSDAHEARVEFRLSDDDARALERVLAGIDGIGGIADGTSAGDLAHARLREQRVASLLGTLDVGGPAIDPTLVDLTFARVLREQSGAVGSQASAEGATAQPEWALCEDDQEAMDALVTAGYDASRVTPSLRARAQRIMQLGELATADPGLTGGQLLIERTLQRVERERREGALRPTGTESGGGGSARGGPRWQDLVSVAAVLLLGASVLLPVVSSLRSHQARTGCAANIAGVASAFGAYAGDHRGHMPVADGAMLAGAGEQSWWQVGSYDHSNSANLFTLRRARYAGLEQLACSGNGHAVRTLPEDARDWPSLHAVSYSYYVMFGRERPNWRGERAAASRAIAEASPETVVLADRSPVILRAVRGETVYPNENSPNHAGSGQWVLRVDGAGMWMQTPVQDGDNIWLPANLEAALDEVRVQARQGATQGQVGVKSRRDAAVERAVRLQGTETPASAQDAFLGP